MRKGLILGLVALFTIFAFTLVGCDNGSSPNPTPPDNRSEVNTLGSLTFLVTSNNHTETFSGFTLGAGFTDESALASYSAPSLALISAAANGATISATITSNAVGTVEFAINASKAALPDADDFEESPLTAATLTTAQFLFAKVTSEKETVRYYVFEMDIGTNSAIDELKIDDKVVSMMPNGSTTIAGAVAIPWHMGEVYSGKSYEVEATPEDDAATVEYAKTDKDGVATLDGDTDFDEDGSALAFDDGDFLFIKVTAANQTNISYYKFLIVYTQTANIHFGTPVIGGANGTDNTKAVSYIDPIWNSIADEEYLIMRPGQEYTTWAPDTFAVAKALWDDDGMYIYIRVVDYEVTEEVGAGDHTVDSIEVFINEDFVGTTSGNYNNIGGQYRLGSNGEKSGDPAVAITGWFANEPAAVWKDDEDILDGEPGYAAVFRVPWRFKDNFPLADQKEVGLEIQINQCYADGGRYGNIVWNKTSTQAYQQCRDMTGAVLELDSHTLRVEAKAPVITAQPVGGVVATAPASISVTANSPDGGTLSYQWYRNTAPNTNPEASTATLIAGANTDTLSLTGETFEQGVSMHYFVVIKNTNASASAGYTEKTVISNYAFILLYDGPTYDEISVRNAALPMYKFEIPDGSTATWANYTSVTMQIKIDEPDFFLEDGAKQVRGRVYGNLVEAAHPFEVSTGGYDIWNYLPGGSNPNNGEFNYNNNFILSNKYGTAATITSQVSTAEIDTWFEVSFKIDGTEALGYPNNDKTQTGTASNFIDDFLPSKVDDADPLYLAFGWTTPGGDTGSIYTYYIKDITLVHGTDTSKNIVLDSSGFAGFAANGDQASIDRQIAFDFRPEIWNIPGTPAKNETAFAGPYSNGVILPIPQEWDVRDYTKFTMVLKAYDADGDEIEIINDAITFKFFATVPGSANDASIAPVYNAGGPYGPITDVAIPANVLNSTSKVMAVAAQTAGLAATADGFAAFIEIVSLKFHD